MKYPLIFQWNVATTFGWGVYGINLLRHWPQIAGNPVYCGSTINFDSFNGMDPLALRAIMPTLIASSQFRAFREERDAAHGGPAPESAVMLHSMGNGLQGSASPGGRVRPCIAEFGAAFIEDTRLPGAVEHAKRFGLILAGSTWNEELLRAYGIGNVRTVIQGVDTSLFHPAPRAGYLDGRFAVFGGGKIEFRKGQDLVVRAFKIFAERHADAVLVTAWNSHWPEGALTINRASGIVPASLSGDGSFDISGWVHANGIRPEQFIDVGTMPNHLMARVVREMDVAVFPNRCEGGTNLVAMECMACAIPVIVADNTGQRDLVATGTTYALKAQRAVDGSDAGTIGWGESDIDEIVNHLEEIYANRTEARRRGTDAAAVLAGWDWKNQIRILHDTMDAVCP